MRCNKKFLIKTLNIKNHKRFCLQDKPEVKLRYNNYYEQPTENDIRLKKGKIELFGNSKENGMTTCDFILPPNFKVEKIKDCKYNMVLISFSLIR